MKNNLFTPIKNGFLGKCPKCAATKLFCKFLTTNKKCKNCQLVFSHHRADDFPPYIVLFIVGHIVVAGALHTEVHFEISLFMHFLLWIPLAVLLSIVLLQPIKGAVIGWQYALKMHGFSHEH